MGRARRGARLCLLVITVTITAAAGCDESGPRVYTAAAYQADGACLDDYASIAVVQATDLASTCPVVCLLIGLQLYVSSVCPPYPSAATIVSAGDSSDCAAASSSLRAIAFCSAASPSDGGVEGASD